jgi:hypothetical protein
MTLIRDALNYAKEAEDNLGKAFPDLLDQLDATATYQWRMSGGKGINGRATVESMDLDDVEESVERSNSPGSPKWLRAHRDTEYELESESDNFHDYPSDEDSRSGKALHPSSGILAIGSQPRPIGGNNTTRFEKNAPFNKSFGLNNALSTSTAEGGLHHWTYGIELGVKPLGHDIPFYDLAKELGLEYYVAHKDETGLVVDHDVNHHLLMHTVTCYSRKGARSRVPDPAVVERALEAGADPNFSFHGSTPWEETLTGAVAHISRAEFDEELQDPISSRGKKWKDDSKTWAYIMQTFVQHGANLEASSKQYYGQPRRKPLAIVQRFPASLASETNDLRRLIEHSSTKAAPRDYDSEIQQLEQATLRKQKQQKKISELGEEPKAVPEAAPAAISTYIWLISWLRPAKKSR